MASLQTEIPIVACDKFSRVLVVLPVAIGESYESGWFGRDRIAYFESSGTSNKGSEMFAHTFFPTPGIYLDDLVDDPMDPVDPTDPTYIPEIKTPINKNVDESLLTKYYIMKTSTFKSLSFDLARQVLPEWQFSLFNNYIEHLAGLHPDIAALIMALDEATYQGILAGTPKPALIKYNDVLQHIFLLYRCIHSYFSGEWQIRQSIALSDAIEDGVWQHALMDFTVYYKNRGAEKIEDNSVVRLKRVRKSAAKPEDKVFDFLQINGAQCDFRAPVQVRPIKITKTTHIYQEIISKLRLLDRALQTRGGKRKKNRKTKRKSKRTKR